MFLSKEEINRRGQEIEEYRSKLYKQQYLPRVRGFPEVRRLVERIKGNGLQVVLAWRRQVRAWDEAHQGVQVAEDQRRFQFHGRALLNAARKWVK